MSKMGWFGVVKVIQESHWKLLALFDRAHTISYQGKN